MVDWLPVFRITFKLVQKLIGTRVLKHVLERGRHKKLQSKRSSGLPYYTPWPHNKHCCFTLSNSTSSLSIPSIASTTWRTYTDTICNERTCNVWTLQSQLLQNVGTLQPQPHYHYHNPFLPTLNLQRNSPKRNPFGNQNFYQN